MISITAAVDLRSLFGPARNQGSRPTCMAFAASDWPNLADACSEAPQIIHEANPWPLLAAGQTQAINLAQAEFAVQQPTCQE